MSEPVRDSLDQAIDRVATRMVSVDDDFDAAGRIVGLLPSRDERRWRLSSLSFQAAAITAVALVVVLVRSFDPGAPARVDLPGLPVAVQEAAPSTVELAGAVAVPNVVRVMPPRRPNAAPLVDLQPAIGLAAIEIPEQLSIQSLVATAPLEQVDAAAVAPISISSLPLSSDGALPFSKE